MASKIYAVYIVTNKPQGVLYVGFTNNLKRRILEHKFGIIDGFTKQYALKKLVYAEQTKYVNNAIAREKQLKSWHRKWKIDLIEKQNPKWNDLYETFFGPMEPENIVMEILNQVQDDKNMDYNKNKQDDKNMENQNGDDYSTNDNKPSNHGRLTSGSNRKKIHGPIN